MDLPVLWYCITILAWVLFFVLEGFDFGVGFLGPLLGVRDKERGAAVATIGPVWDGNEVWLVAAIGVTFAAFPDWYASLVSGLYLPFILILLLLAVRGVAIEFRAKHDTASWRMWCDLAMAASSLLVAATWGAVLGVLVSGLAMGADGEVHGGGLLRSLEPLFGPWAVLGGLVGVLLSALHGATFLSLRTRGVLRVRARWVALLTAPILIVITLAMYVASGHPVVGVAALVLLLAAVASWRGVEWLAFAATTVATAGTVVAVFTAHLSDASWVLLPSTLDAAHDITLRGAAASDYAFSVITWAGAFILPVVVAYQVWSYIVFRKRVHSGFGTKGSKRRVAATR